MPTYEADLVAFKEYFSWEVIVTEDGDRRVAVIQVDTWVPGDMHHRMYDQAVRALKRSGWEPAPGAEWDDGLIEVEPVTDHDLGLATTTIPGADEHPFKGRKL